VELEPPVLQHLRVAVAEQVVQALPVAAALETQPGLPLLAGEIMQDDGGPVGPVEALREHAPRAGIEDLALTPADLRGFPARADQPLHPVQQRAVVATLVGDVDGGRPVLVAGYDRPA